MSGLGLTRLLEAEDVTGKLFLTMAVAEGEYDGDEFKVVSTIGVGGMGLIVSFRGRRILWDLRPLIEPTLDRIAEGA